MQCRGSDDAMCISNRQSNFTRRTRGQTLTINFTVLADLTNGKRGIANFNGLDVR